MEKSICFVLPVYGCNPVGGIKVVYEYANRFSLAGYKVGLFYPRAELKIDSLRSFLRSLYYLIKGLIFRQYKAGKWFLLKKNIKQFLISPFYKNKALNKIARYNCVCATSVETAYYIAPLNNRKNCFRKLFYFIQDFEAWNGKSESYVLDSYKLPLNKIVIAPWLLDKVKLAGETAELIYNGFDFNSFSLYDSIENRNSFHISMLYHVNAHKRTEDCIKALQLVHERYPAIRVTAFGAPLPPKDLPDWFKYIRQPDKKTLNGIYNSSAIYVAASETEGFGLTVGESMICGNAVCCTENGGFSCMVRNFETGLLSPVRDIESLARNIERCISDKEFRVKLAKAGNEFIRSFSWEPSFVKFRNYLESL